jgi:hypothetical protein
MIATLGAPRELYRSDPPHNRSDILNYIQLAQYCDKFLTFYKIFLGTAGISALLVVSVNLHQLFTLVAKGNVVIDESLTRDLRAKLIKWRKTEGKDYTNPEGNKISTLMAVGGLFKRKTSSAGDLNTDTSLSLSEKRLAMLRSLNERFEFMNERLILNRRIGRSKVGLAVVVFEGDYQINERFLASPYT